MAAVLYFCHEAFVPIALALLFALLLSGPVERLHARRIPRGLSASLILILVVGAVLGSVDLLWNPAQQWYNSAPQTLDIIKSKVKPVASFVRHLDDLRSASDPLSPSADSPLTSRPFADNQSTSSQFLSATRHLIVSSIATVVITLFLLTGGPPMVARMTGRARRRSARISCDAGHRPDQVGGCPVLFDASTAQILALGGATAAIMSMCRLALAGLMGSRSGHIDVHPVRRLSAGACAIDDGGFGNFRQPGAHRRGGVQLYRAVHACGADRPAVARGSASGSKSLGRFSFRCGSAGFSGASRGS